MTRHPDRNTAPADLTFRLGLFSLVLSFPIQSASFLLIIRKPSLHQSQTQNPLTPRPPLSSLPCWRSWKLTADDSNAARIVGRELPHRAGEQGQEMARTSSAWGICRSSSNPPQADKRDSLPNLSKVTVHETCTSGCVYVGQPKH